MVTLKDHICHSLRALTKAIKHTPGVDINAQLAAITALQDILHALPFNPLKQPQNAERTAPLPRVATPQRVQITARAAAAPTAPLAWTVVTPSQRQRTLQLDKPMAERTQACTTMTSSNRFAALAHDDNSMPALKMAFTTSTAMPTGTPIALLQ